VFVSWFVARPFRVVFCFLGVAVFRAFLVFRPWHLLNSSRLPPSFPSFVSCLSVCRPDGHRNFDFSLVPRRFRNLVGARDVRERSETREQGCYPGGSGRVSTPTRPDPILAHHQPDNPTKNPLGSSFSIPTRPIDCGLSQMARPTCPGVSKFEVPTRPTSTRLQNHDVRARPIWHPARSVYRVDYVGNQIQDFGPLHYLEQIMVAKSDDVSGRTDDL